MKKRYFLSAGIATIGSIWLSDYLPNKVQGKTIKIAENHQFEIMKTEQEWRKILTPAQFEVLRQHGTERAGSSPLDLEHGNGTFACAGCNLPLFTSTTKYNSGTGWPSFYAPIEGAIGTTIDRAFAMTRTEVHCRRCGGHLGHVFADGPKPTGKRYCMNGVAMKFIAA
ncbi:peptide-methionine (R)-S-oxide reductase MsrB [Microcoleus sp. PH2017_28_MFU_U_A]|uniref:peptide-methionine (R)-S-oxide reductase MsrB n=1 Tax=unclassified Microcoleus TaxID=2642155 RepID=UPI001D698745|nr:peptide-methionine (R)-S-oxide reductase MsrB [Microcoleus sp. PH2017_28_MFU_U_A]MCC3412981.1 peptide-methionine (R)-S-oxide reductase MsrB [Microcoleus sp. PH2017_02_FOX_O_A]MCC3420882.1 peptide-methionine (R)-S-oxide reductase MsrB [Microcoleus sp. PH2017_07_MST_O_A]MCC3444901.1 peptide-methionine (R)-S-oxide reductase MsrB [Microcoleus sp. PH2017_03_ELD_O_A]MCC3448405.1 peptide-methionine (R)-S-oxide reductase MsrB [Microcoleus sp. PH2017_09_SFU_O_A]MCC3513585.1 peptide-methionine (R)-S-